MKKVRFIKKIASRAGAYVVGTLLGMAILDGIKKIVIMDYKRETSQHKAPGITGGKTFNILNDKNEVIYTGTFNEETGEVIANIE